MNPSASETLPASGNDAWLSGLPVETRQAVVARCSFLRSRKGQPVVERDDGTRQVYFVVSGWVRVMALSPEGRESSYRDIGEGGSFGELSALDGRPRSATVVALDDAVLAVLPADDFTELMRTHWSFCQRVLLQLVDGVRELTLRLYERDHLSVQQRLLSELLRMAREAGRLPPDELTAWRTSGERLPVGGAGAVAVPLPPLPTHEILASRIGTSRLQVTRELGKLQREGLLARSGPGWTIVDLMRLQARVEQAQAG